MAGNSLYQDIASLFSSDGTVPSMLKRTSASYLPWETFVKMRVPETMSPLETWTLLKAMNRAYGVEFPIPDLEGVEYWYQRTHEIADAVARIQCLCNSDSGLYRRLTETRNRLVLVQSRISETVAAARLDGLGVSEKDALELLQADRAPRNAGERVVRNTLTAIDRLDELVGQPFSRELFMHLRSMILDGVDVNALPESTPRMGLLRGDYRNDEVRAGSKRQIRYFSDYANHLSGDPHDHPVVRALLLADMFRYYRPLPDVNSQVGRLTFRLYALKAGLPVLGMLPISQLKVDWEEERLESSVVTIPHSGYLEATEHDGADLTGYVTLALQLTLAGLQDLEWQLRDLEREDEQLRDLLQHDPEINHRQRSILGRALRDPKAEFRIAYHKTKHNVVYATARADLLELADKGLLAVGKQGRAMVFRARPNLRQFIETQYHAE